MTDQNLTPEQLADINRQLFMSPEAKEAAAASATVAEEGHEAELAAYEEAAVVPQIKLDLRKIPLPVFAELEGFFYREYMPNVKALSDLVHGLPTAGAVRSPTELNLALLGVLYEHNGERGIDLPDLATLALEDIDFVGSLVADTMQKRVLQGAGITKK